MPYHIYHLIDPVTKTVRYVGKSTSPSSRLREHIKESQARQNTEKKIWIADLLARGLQPVMAIVASYAEEAPARERESEECHKYKETITNLHDPAKGAKAIRESLEKKEKRKNKSTFPIDTNIIP